MFPRRAAVVFIALVALSRCATITAAQQSKRMWFIRVTYFARAVVAGVRVQMGSTSEDPDESVITDRDGQAALDVFTGNRTVTVTARGFQRWSEEIAESSLSDAPVIVR